nr:MMPL family transporter [Flavobacteriia bacterium]
KKTFQSHFDSQHSRLEINGFAAVYTQLNQFILKSQQHSFFLALLGSFVCLLLFVKRIKTSLLILLPNLLPLSVLAISMVALDIPLGVTTAMITPIMLGIVMDDSIHLLYHYKTKNNKLLSAKQRMSHSLHYNGKALLTATISLVAGFLVIATSAVPSVVDFGLLCAITVVSALLSDLFFLSALLKKFDS